MTGWPWYILLVGQNRERRVASLIGDEKFVTWLPEQLIPIRPHYARKRSDASHVRHHAYKLVYPRHVLVQAEFVPSVAHLLREGERWVLNHDYAYRSIPDYQVRIWRDEIDRLNESARLLGKITKAAKRKWRSMHEALAEMKTGEMEQAA